MNRQQFDEQYLDFLDGDKTPAEKAAWERSLAQDPELLEEFQSLKRMTRLFHDRLPDADLPRRLVPNTLKALGIKRPWYEFLGTGFFRPALVGLGVLALTLGITYQVRQWKGGSVEVAKVDSAPKVDKGNANDLSRQDFQLAARSLEPRLYSQTWRPQPRISNGLVSFASYGGGSMPSNYETAESTDIPRLDEQTNLALAQFSHQQALRMRAMGDFKGAATQLAAVIKAYPSYPHVFVAAAQRIDCLLKSGQAKQAKQELLWLTEHSPDLAYLVQQRWGDSLR